MSETLTATPEQGTTHRPQEMTVNGDQLVNHFFGGEPAVKKEEPIKVEQKPETPAGAQPAKVETKIEDTKPDTAVWFKEEFKDFGFEDATKAKEQITEWKKAQEAKPAELKFENEQMKQLHELIRDGKTKEVREFLEKHEKINQYTTGELTEDSAAEVIKLSMKLKYGNLSDSEINYKYNKEYSIPQEPVWDKDKEDEDDFNEKHNEWKEKVSDIKMNKMINAKLAIPELEQAKTKIVLPEISKPSEVQPKQLTQEELDAVKKQKEGWLKLANSSITDLTGFSTTLKFKDGDKEVEVPISYGLSPEEKMSLTNKFNDFANNDFDIFKMFKERWVDASGNDNIPQMVKDLSWLYYGENAAQKLTNEGANQRIENYIKGKKQININETTTPGTAVIVKEDKTEMDKVRDAFWQ